MHDVRDLRDLHSLHETVDISIKSCDVALVVLNRDQPLLGLTPGRQEHSAVVLEQPVRVAVLVVDSEEVAKVLYRLSAEDDAALGPDRHDARGETVSFNRRGDAVDGLRAQRV